MRPRSLAALTALTLASAPFLAGAASSADTTVGDSTKPDNTQSCAGNATFLQTSSTATAGAPSYTVPTAGVITSWRTVGQSGTASTRTLKVARVSGASVTVTGSGSPVLVPADTAVTQPVRIPVRAGDTLGVYFATGAGLYCIRYTGSTGDQVTQVAGDSAVGSTAPTSASQFLRVSAAATVEPDADGDGFGDTTQDSCPTQAGTQGACKDLVAPDTTITSVKAGKAKAKPSKPATSGKPSKKKLKKAKVTVAFTATEAATFTCSVDGAASTACTSPLTLKLTKGTHTVAVRATDTAGNVDPSPATTTLTVKKAKSASKKKK